MYTLGNGPTRLLDWFGHYVAAGDVLRVVYQTTKGTPPAPRADVGAVLKLRGFKPIGFPATTNRAQLGVDVVALHSGKLGMLLGRYLIAGSANIEHQVVSVIRLRQVSAVELDRAAAQTRTEIARNESIARAGRTVDDAVEGAKDSAREVFSLASFVARHAVPLALVGGGLYLHSTGALRRLGR